MKAAFALHFISFSQSFSVNFHVVFELSNNGKAISNNGKAISRATVELVGWHRSVSGDKGGVSLLE